MRTYYYPPGMLLLAQARPKMPCIYTSYVCAYQLLLDSSSPLVDPAQRRGMLSIMQAYDQLFQCSVFHFFQAFFFNVNFFSSGFINVLVYYTEDDSV